MNEWKQRYEHYIRSNDWQAKRLLAFVIHGARCFGCGTDEEIDIHHKTYKRLFVEDVEADLIPLCRKCHKRVHQLRASRSSNVWAATELFLKRKAKTPRGRAKKKAKRPPEPMRFRRIEKNGRVRQFRPRFHSSDIVGPKLENVRARLTEMKCPRAGCSGSLKELPGRVICPRCENYTVTAERYRELTA